MEKFAGTSRPWLAAFALAATGVLACANPGTDNLMTVGGAGTNGAAGTTPSAGTTGSTGGTPGSAGAAGGTTGSSAGTTGSSGGTTGSAAGTTGSTAGTTGSSGGTTGSTAGTTGSTAGTTGGTAGTTGGAAGGSATGFTGPFDCTLVAGLLITREWYTAGFENDGVDGTKFEGKFQHYGYIDIWAQDPPAGFAWNAPIEFACTKNSTAPDRVIYTAWSWELAYMTDQYVMKTAEAIRKFKKNYPSMKRLDLLTLARCPPDPAKPETAVSGRQCNPNAKIPPIAGTTDHNAGQQDCYVNKEVDTALDMVAAMPEFAGLVYVGPKFYSPACRAPVDGAHLGNNNTQVAKDIATYYKDPAHP
jgi:hypothetical protein